MSDIPAKTYGLARVEIPSVSSFGWQVRMQRRGEKSSRFFSDANYGGLAHAYAAALAWRDSVLAEWQSNERARICEISSRNASGVIGVSRVVVRAANGAEYQFWQATWCPSPGVRKSVKFSVKKHGDQVAFRLAIEARNNGIGS
jgi:hypothetical protein